MTIELDDEIEDYIIQEINGAEGVDRVIEMEES